MPLGEREFHKLNVHSEWRITWGCKRKKKYKLVKKNRGRLCKGDDNASVLYSIQFGRQMAKN